jgi:MoxR-like ATPase
MTTAENLEINRETCGAPPRSNGQSNDFCDEVRRRVAQVVVGQDVVVERILIALFTGGHLMLQGVPGLAKTLLVNAVAKAVDLQFARIQFTIDMLPSDVIGSEILDQRTGDFRVRKGPVFTNLLLADEINRAAPKAQSAMLEAMQERKVTIGNESFRLPVPFLVIATQNPIEQSGTFELPEAQLDRFLLYHRLDYPSVEQEQEILRRQLAMGLKKDESGGAVPKTAFDMILADPCATIGDLSRAMEMVQKVHVSEVFLKHSVELARRTRESKLLDFGCSPRASIALATASRARAFIHGRDYVVPEDLFDLAEDVILHRIRLTYEAAAEGHTGREVLEAILGNLA